MGNLDLYAYLASLYFNCSIEDCQEINNDGSLNNSGSVKRNLIKRTILSQLGANELTQEQTKVWQFLTSKYPKLTEISQVNETHDLVTWLKDVIGV